MFKVWFPCPETRQWPTWAWLLPSDLLPWGWTRNTVPTPAWGGSHSLWTQVGARALGHHGQLPDCSVLKDKLSCPLPWVSPCHQHQGRWPTLRRLRAMYQAVLGWPLPKQANRLSQEHAFKMDRYSLRAGDHSSCRQLCAVWKAGVWPHWRATLQECRNDSWGFWRSHG